MRRNPARPLPTIRLGPHEVTRLIVGGNPVYGYSHFNKHFDRHLAEWHTPERVLELLRRCEACGINTWQNSYAERTLADLDRYREAGGTMHWLCLGKPDWDRHPEHVADAARHKPIGVAPHGARRAAAPPGEARHPHRSPEAHPGHRACSSVCPPTTRG